VAASSGDTAVAVEAAEDLAGVVTRLDQDVYRGLAGVASASAKLAARDPVGALPAAEEGHHLLCRSEWRAIAARASEVLGRARAGAGAEGSVEALEVAVAGYEACGAVRRRDHALEALRNLGGRGRRAAGAILGPEALTAREREVARLTAQGHTAREIGERLFIGRRTVETHLANAYAKLGVTSKVELARRALELGL
jgi:DNA-binding CsgD family transcriptional regulator